MADNDVLLADCYSAAQDVAEFILLFFFLSNGIRFIKCLELQWVHQFFNKLLLSAGGPVTHGLRYPAVREQRRAAARALRQCCICTLLRSRQLRPFWKPPFVRRLITTLVLSLFDCVSLCLHVLEMFLICFGDPRIGAIQHSHLRGWHLWKQKQRRQNGSGTLPELEDQLESDLVEPKTRAPTAATRGTLQAKISSAVMKGTYPCYLPPVRCSLSPFGT